MHHLVFAHIHGKGYEMDNWQFCPVCDQESGPMGTLGSTLYYHCHGCGMTFSVPNDAI